jgi:hypothetical protein
MSGIVYALPLLWGGMVSTGYNLNSNWLPREEKRGGRERHCGNAASEGASVEIGHGHWPAGRKTARVNPVHYSTF